MPKIPKNKEIKRELRYGHMASCGFAKYVKKGYENFDGDWVNNSEWEYDDDGYDRHLRSMELTDREIEHLIGKYDQEVDLGRVQAFEKHTGRMFVIGEDHA